LPGYDTRKLNVRIGSRQWTIRSLSDKQQYADPNGEAKRAGICSASWSLFGQLWPASQMLAKAVKQIDIKNRRILELGCGLGLPSLVLHARGADVVASDRHPLSKPFLEYNAALNRLTPLTYLDLAWEDTTADNATGRFDVIIGSDILYEPNQAEMLADLVNRLATAKAKVLITCPGRGYRNRFSTLLKASGFQLTTTSLAFEENETPPFKGRLLCYRREM
jgi:predicted nicotinamide N-methyase